MKGVHAHRLRRQFGADDAIDARMKWDVRRVSPRDGDQKKYCFTQGWPYGGVFLSPGHTYCQRSSRSGTRKLSPPISGVTLQPIDTPSPPPARAIYQR